MRTKRIFYGRRHTVVAFLATAATYVQQTTIDAGLSRT
jgi:hypothetical protein